MAQQSGPALCAANGLEPTAKRAHGADLVFVLLQFKPIGSWRVHCGALRIQLSASVLTAMPVSPWRPTWTGPGRPVPWTPQGGKEGLHRPFGKK